MHFTAFLLPLLASIHTVQSIPLDKNQAAVSTSSPLPLPSHVSETASPGAIPTPTLSPELIVRAPAPDTDSTTSTSTQSSTSTTAYYTETSDCTPTVAPDKNGYVPPDQCNAMYDYYPSFNAAVAFSVIFGLLFMVHLVQAFTYKTGFVWVIVMGVGWELGGYVTRALSTKNQQSSGLATATQLLVLLAPLWVNAFDYMILARMMWFFLPEKRIWIFRPNLLAIIFVCLDFGSFLVQATGGLMATPSAGASTIQTGLHIYMGGIGVQEAFIVCFTVLAIQFHRQMLQLERVGALSGDKLRWRGLLYSLYFSLLAITVRIIYRLVEFTGGVGLNNAVTTHEWFMYVFDAFPMLLAAGVWCVLHPGRILRGPDAKLPPSGIGRILCCGYCACCCCCCKGRGRKEKKMKKSGGMQGMQSLPDRSPSEEELRPVQAQDGMYYSRPLSPMDMTRGGAYEPYRSQM